MVMKSPSRTCRMPGTAWGMEPLGPEAMMVSKEVFSAPADTIR